MRNSISSRLIVMLTLAAALILGSGMLVDYKLSRQEILRGVIDDATLKVQAVVNDMENWLNGIESTTLLLARILEQREYSQGGLQQMLRDVVTNNDEIFGAAIALNPAYSEQPRGFAPYYFSQQGSVQYADLTNDEALYTEQDWYTQPIAAGKAIWSEPYFDAGGGEINMTTFSAPVFRINDQGERFLYAVVTADVSLDSLHQVLQQLHLGETSYALLFSREGIMMSTRTQRSAMKHYSEMPYQGVDLDSWRSIFNKALNGETTTSDFPCPEDSGRCTIRLGMVKTTGWPIGVVVDQEEIFAPLHAYEIKTAIVGGATLLMMVLSVFFVTSRLTRPLQDLSRATEQMSRGNMDIPLPKASGKDEVARLVRSFSSMNRDLKRYIADLETATANRSRVEGELAAAREIQMSMLPGGGEALLEENGVKLWARVLPAKTVGGDLYTCFRQGDELFVAVGDVSDKGVPAALFMARAISLIQQLSGTDIPPEQAMAELNDALERDNQSCMFVTLFLGVLNIATGSLRFASAGHTEPSLLRGNAVTIVEQQTGPALGLATGQVFPQNTLQLVPGDRLAIYTDGIDEAFNSDREMYGVERFNLALQQSAGLAVDEAGQTLIQSVETHAGAQPQSDDITLMLLQYPKGHAPVSQRFSLESQLMGRVQAWMEPTLESWEVPLGVSMEIYLVAEELVSNVQKYAGLEPDDELELVMSLADQTLVVEVRDRGQAFNPLHDGHRSTLGADIESAEIGGLGVHLITQLTDKQSYRRENETNVLRVEKNLSAAQD